MTDELTTGDVALAIIWLVAVLLVLVWIISGIRRT